MLTAKIKGYNGKVRGTTFESGLRTVVNTELKNKKKFIQGNTEHATALRVKMRYLLDVIILSEERCRLYRVSVSSTFRKHILFSIYEEG